MSLSKNAVSEILIQFQDSIRFWTAFIKKTYFKRSRKIKTIHIFHFILGLAADDSHGYETIIHEMNEQIDKIDKDPTGFYVSKSSIYEAKEKTLTNMWKAIQEDIYKCLRKHLPKRRIFAIDGTRMIVPNALNNNFKTAKQDYYPKAHVSYLYDIDFKIPIHAVISNKICDRSALLKHLDALEPGDILVLDRGYYSKKILNTLKKHKIEVIFRLSKACFKNEWDNTETDYLLNFNENIIRLVKYELQGSKNKKIQYMLLTTLIDKSEYTLDFLKEAYRYRWRIESAFKYAKGNFSLCFFHSQTLNGLYQEFYAAFLLLTVARLLEYYTIAKHYNDKVYGGLYTRNIIKPEKEQGKDKMLKFSKCIFFVNRRICSIFDPSTNIIELFDRLSKYIMRGTTYIRPGRRYHRFSKQPNNKWSIARKITTDKIS